MMYVEHHKKYVVVLEFQAFHQHAYCIARLTSI